MKMNEYLVSNHFGDGSALIGHEKVLYNRRMKTLQENMIDYVKQQTRKGYVNAEI